MFNMLCLMAITNLCRSIWVALFYITLFMANCQEDENIHKNMQSSAFQIYKTLLENEELYYPKIWTALTLDKNNLDGINSRENWKCPEINETLYWPATDTGQSSNSIPLCLDEGMKILKRTCGDDGIWEAAPNCTSSQKNINPCPSDMQLIFNKYCYKIIKNTTFPPNCPYQNNMLEWDDYIDLKLTNKPIWMPITRNDNQEYGIDLLRSNEYLNYKSPLEFCTDSCRMFFYSGTFMDKKCIVYHNSTHLEAVRCNATYSAVCAYHTLSRQENSYCSQIFIDKNCKQSRYEDNSTCFCEAPNNHSQSENLAEFLLPYQNLLYESLTSPCLMGLKNTKDNGTSTIRFMWLLTKNTLNYTYWATTEDINFEHEYGVINKDGWLLHPNDSQDCRIYQIRKPVDKGELHLEIADDGLKLEIINYTSFLSNDEGEPIVYCFTNSDAKSLLYKIKTFTKSKLNNTHYNYIFSRLNKAQSGPGFYWCEAFIHPLLESVKSEPKMVANNYAEFVVIMKLNNYEEKLSFYPLSSQNIATIQTLFKNEIQNTSFFPRIFKINEINEDKREMTITFHLSSADADDTDEVFNHLKAASIAQKTFEFVEFRSAYYCAKVTDTLPNGQTVTWPHTLSGNSNDPENGYCVSDKVEVIRRQCTGQFIDGVYWLDLDEKCTFYISSMVTEKLLEPNSGSELMEISKNYNSFTTLDFVLTSKRLKDITEMSPNIEMIAKIVNNLMMVPRPVLVSAQMNFKATDELIHTIDHILENTDFEEYKTENFAIKSINLIENNSYGIVFSNCSQQLRYCQIIPVTNESYLTDDNNKPPTELKNAAIILSPELYDQLIDYSKENESYIPKLTISLYHGSQLFLDLGKFSKYVFGILFPEFPKKEFSGPLRIYYFEAEKQNKLPYNCSYWKFDDEKHGSWMAESTEDLEDVIVCEFLHVTNFAVTADETNYLKNGNAEFSILNIRDERIDVENMQNSSLSSQSYIGIAHTDQCGTSSLTKTISSLHEPLDELHFEIKDIPSAPNIKTCYKRNSCQYPKPKQNNSSELSKLDRLAFVTIYNHNNYGINSITKETFLSKSDCDLSIYPDDNAILNMNEGKQQYFLFDSGKCSLTANKSNSNDYLEKKFYKSVKKADISETEQTTCSLFLECPRFVSTEPFMKYELKLKKTEKVIKSLNARYPENSIFLLEKLNQGLIESFNELKTWSLEDNNYLNKLAEMLNIVAKISKAVMYEAQETYQLADRILYFVDVILFHVNTTNQVLTNNTMIIVISKQDVPNFRGFYVTNDRRVFHILDKQEKEKESNRNYIDLKVVLSDQLHQQILVSKTRIIFVLFYSDIYFPDKAHSVKKPVVEVLFPDLYEPLKAEFNITYKYTNDLGQLDKKCTFWDHEVVRNSVIKSGQWRQESLAQSNNQWLTCTFKHATHFGLIILSKNITNDLEYILYFNLTAVEKLTEVISITKNSYDSLVSVDIFLISRIIGLSLKEGAMADLISEIISNLFNVPHQVLRQSQKEHAATDIILQNVDNLGKMLDDTFINNNSNFSLIVKNLNIVNLTGVILHSCTEYICSIDQLSRFVDIDQFASNDSISAMLLFSEKLINQIRNLDSDSKVIITIYHSNVLFNELYNDRKTTKIFGVVFPGLNISLDGMISVAYSIDRYSKIQTQCAYWYYKVGPEGNMRNGTTGRWVREIVDDKRSRVAVCNFTHVTHFSMLLSNDDDYHDDSLLNTLTDVGCILSLIGIALIILTAVLLKRWRRNTGNKILINFSIAICIKIVMLYISEYVRDHYTGIGCIVSGSVLHYATLSECAWMLTIAILQFKRFVEVLGGPPNHALIKALICGWVFPIIPVICVILIDPDNYQRGNSQLCYPSQLGLYLGIWLPLLMIVSINCIIYVFIMYHVSHKKTECIDNTNHDILFQWRLALLLFFMLGLTWLFGFLGEIKGDILFVYLFNIGTSIQGLVMFLFFIVFNKSTRTMYSQVAKQWFYTKGIFKVWSIRSSTKARN